MDFTEKLKAQRERLGLTQAELAAFLDVSPRAVWQWEKGMFPHVLTQEGALARLTKAKRRSQGTNNQTQQPHRAQP
jgi:transcriptional regulator with XRE-family HTH domain